MFKCLALQQLYNLSDEEFEFQLRDRLTFIWFVDISFVEAPHQRNTREQNQTIKDGLSLHQYSGVRFQPVRDIIGAQ